MSTLKWPIGAHQVHMSSHVLSYEDNVSEAHYLQSLNFYVSSTDSTMKISPLKICLLKTYHNMPILLGETFNYSATLKHKWIKHSMILGLVWVDTYYCWVSCRGHGAIIPTLQLMLYQNLNDFLNNLRVNHNHAISLCL